LVYIIAAPEIAVIAMLMLLLEQPVDRGSSERAGELV
jgi:hypothetical protein